MWLFSRLDRTFLLATLTRDFCRQTDPSSIDPMLPGAWTQLHSFYACDFDNSIDHLCLRPWRLDQTSPSHDKRLLTPSKTSWSATSSGGVLEFHLSLIFSFHFFHSQMSPTPLFNWFSLFISANLWTHKLVILYLAYLNPARYHWIRNSSVQLSLLPVGPRGAL